MASCNSTIKDVELQPDEQTAPQQQQQLTGTPIVLLRPHSS